MLTGSYVDGYGLKRGDVIMVDTKSCSMIVCYELRDSDGIEYTAADLIDGKPSVIRGRLLLSLLEGITPMITGPVEL